MKRKTQFLFVFLLLLCSCSNQKSVSTNTTLEKENQDNTPNILLIIADDLGCDAFPAYGVGALKPKMPTIEKLISNGLRFTNFWAYPTCTPTRASIITGKHAFRTNVRQVGDVLNEQETILHTLLNQKTNSKYESAVIGKWHLSRDAEHPNKMGLQYYSGLLSGGVKNYNQWQHTENGVTNKETKYITTKFTDLAINWVSQQRNQKGQKPWFLWLAYTAPHLPFHVPPSTLHSNNNLTNTEEDIEKNPMPYYFSMIEAMDTEIGRLLKSIPKAELDNTVIIFIGDNGSPNQVVQAYEKRKAKGSIYQGGINVPLFVTGKNVTRVSEVEDALVNSTDIFATILELSGTGISEIHDSKSFVPLFTNKQKEHKNYLYSELKNKRRSGYTIRNKKYKYLKYSGVREELFDLEADPFETDNIISDPNLHSIKEELINKVAEMKK